MGSGRSSGLLTVLAFATVVVAGCQGMPGATSGPGSPEPSPDDPSELAICRVFTTDEMSGLIGIPMAVAADSSHEHVCTYRSSEPADPIEVSIRGEDVLEDVPTIRSTFPDVVDVAIGDETIWSPQVGTMWTRLGDLIWAVQVFGTDSEERALEMASAVARALADRISGSS